jgi:hypothetical protein
MADRITKIVYTLMIAELCIGGGGRFTAWGPVSLRMVLFSAAMVIVMISILNGKTFPREDVKLILFFFATTSLGLVVGLVNGAETRFWWEDVKPLLYFLALPFFSLAIRTEADIVWTGRIIKFASIVLAVAFIALILLIYLNLLPFEKVYAANLHWEEFFFRGRLTLFYKGLLYLCIGILFFFFVGMKPNYLPIVLLSLAVGLSFTRGFVVALCLTFSFYFFYRNTLAKAFFFLIFSLILGFYGRQIISTASQWVNSSVTYNPNLLGDRQYSDDQRLIQFKEVIGQTTLSSAVVGHGFGRGVPSRPIHMEISYMEFFQKQGLIGLAFWGFMAWTMWKRYRTAEPSGQADAFFLSGAFVFLQSATNQYVNNPIGMAMVLLSLVSLDKLKR